jgi:hypothetical protein
LYGLGVDQSHKPEPFAAVSVLTFHDACEMFLQIAAEHNGVAPPKQRSPDFLEYWPLFEQQAQLQVTSKASMNPCGQEIRTVDEPVVRSASASLPGA